MSQPVHPDTLATEVKDLKRRMAAMESHSPQVTTVLDGSGRVRFISGKLDQLGGAYVGTFGDASLDASGNVISDSVGLQAVIAQVGDNPLSSGLLGPFAFTTTFTTITASTTNWTVSRPVSVLILASANFYISGGTANYGDLILNSGYSGGATQSNPGYSTLAGGIQNFSTFTTIACVPGNSYLSQWMYRHEGGAASTFTLANGEIQVYRLGS